MPQIAQQDYLLIRIADLTAVTDAEKEIIREKMKQGIIFDCLLLVAGSTFARVFSASYFHEDLIRPLGIDVYDSGNEQMVYIYVGEQ